MKGELTQKTINESKIEFQHYFEKAAIGLGASSPDKQFIEVNKRLCQMLGYSRKELLGLTWLAITHSEDYDKNIELFQQAAEGKIDRYELNKRFIRKDGSILYVRLSTVCQHKEDGTIDHFLTSYQDITVQKEAEEALKESEERFRSLFENSPVGIYRTTPDGAILMANPALIRMLGYKSLKDLRQRDLKKENNYGDRYPRSRFQQLIESEGEIKGIESAWNRKDGSVIYIRESATLVKDKDGQPLYYEGTVEDISDRKIAEGALKESEEKFRSLFENMVEGFAYCKMVYENEQPVDFIYLDINTAFESLTGLKKVVGKKVSEVIPGIRETDSELLKIYGRVASTGKTERIETFLEALKMWFSISIYSPSKGYFVAVFDVIDERKRVEQELKESEEKYRRMVDLSPDAVIIHSEGKTVFANPSALRMAGAVSMDQMLSTPAINFVHPESREEAVKRIMQIYETHEPVDFIEEKFICFNNEVKNVEVIGIPINYNGKPCIQTVARDITKRKTAEYALKETNEFNNSLLKTIPYGMDIVDEEGYILFMSENFIELFGSDSIGKKCWDLYHDNKIQCTGCPLKNGLKIGETDSYESKSILGGRVFEISHTGMMYKGKKAMLQIFHDVTERKRVEQELIEAKEKAEENEKLKSAFLANMSHEIRTPMNGILGFAELLREPRLTGEEQQEYIDIIQKSGERMLTIINDIITISKVEAGQMKVLLNQTNLNDLSEYIFKFFKPEAEHKGLAFSYSSQLPDQEALILTDKEKVSAILINLVKNAFKFTFKGDSVEFGYEVKNSEYTFFVKDTGIGIPPEQTDIIFERFRQVNDSLNRKFEGAGLGLSISKAYVEMLGGKIWVESEYQAGSTFYFTIPDSGLEKAENAENKGLREKNEINKLKILIVDDDETSSVLLSKLMKDYGKEIFKANNGAKAVEICRYNPDIDLIMMDIQMPEKDGYQATKQIRESNKEVIIIAQTAFALSGDDLKAREAGCSDYIAKPIKRDSLDELINKWFK